MPYTISYGGDDTALLETFLAGCASLQTDDPGWHLTLRLRYGREIDGRDEVEGYLRGYHGTGPDDPERGDDVLVLAVADPVTAVRTGEELAIPVGAVYGVDVA